MRLTPAFSALLLISLANFADASFVTRMDENVPVNRLVENVSAYVKAHPNDVEGYYTLARVHSLAYTRSFITTTPVPPEYRNEAKQRALEARRPRFAKPERSLVAVPVGSPGHRGPKKLPEDLGSYQMEPRRSGTKVSSEDLEHLCQSVHFFTVATRMDPQNGLYWLGLGWMYEEGVNFAPRLGKPWKDLSDSAPVSSQEWRHRALVCYRQAYAHGRIVAGDAWQDRLRRDVRVEAADSFSRVLNQPGHSLTPDERRDVQRMLARVAPFRRAPVSTTPIILPLKPNASFSSLFARERRVRFDLASDGLGKRWPWVGANTGILVWDPHRTGRITSGRQLFGTVTWWIFWDNGYKALAALDNNGDGQLTGKELNGIGIWRDANGNGVSDAGDVKPLQDWGITSLSTRATQQVNGMPSNLRGATRADGSALPTYDWTPRSLN